MRLAWDLAPAAADAALEVLNESRIKRPQLNHVVLCPRLLTYRWQNRLHKLADFVFELPLDRYPFWPLSAFEPLIIGVVLHFSAQSPWQVKQSSRLLGLDRELRSLWTDPSRDPGAFPRALCQLPGVLDSV
jgi:hypothetical protein